MKKTIKGIISVILTICILSGSIVTTFAAFDEVYLSDLRIIYADSYSEAKKLLSETMLEGYKVLKENLNSNSGNTGVWLAYKTTLNVDDAITDIAVMQMGGGYSEGNYQEMIKKSRLEYLEMGKTYLAAIRYFAKAYKAGSFLAQSAFRQLNFYTGLDDYGTKRLGDIMVSGALTDSELATFFLQGNTYVLKNVRSLLSMGVSYNKDGMTYFEKVEESAELMNDDPSVFAYDDYDELAGIIADNIAVFRNMFDELSAYEDDLNYADDNFTKIEIKYSEYKAVAEMMRAVKYLDGKTLYEFCMEYDTEVEDYTSLYPLVDALNEGQEAMTTARCYYDIIRYSMTDLPKELINEEIAKLEQTYGEAPVGVYTGVDRSLYEETFALTSSAVRADAYSDSMKLADSLFGDAWMMRAAEISLGTLDIAMSVWTIESSSDLVKKSEAAESTAKAINRYINMVRQVTNAIGGQAVNFGPFINTAIKKYTVFDLFNDMLYNYDKSITDQNWTFDKVYACFMHEVVAGGMIRSEETKLLMKLISAEVDSAESAVMQKPPSATNTVFGLASKFTTLFYFLDAALLATSAISLGVKVYDHYHPTYSDIPKAMVDIVNTDKESVYVKYDVVYEAEPQRDGGYSAADLNAFEGQRWNALYYTKSYEAGKPLLERFVRSKINNRAYEEYLPVHRFGEEICYDLNKYNFSSSSDNIFLSIKQSDKQKTSVTNAPALVGSVFGTGLIIVSLVSGVGVGIIGTVGTRAILKRRKKKTISSDTAAE